MKLVWKIALFTSLFFWFFSPILSFAEDSSTQYLQDADTAAGLIPDTSTSESTPADTTQTPGESPASGCQYDDGEGATIAQMIQGCKPAKWQISTDNEDYTFSGWAKERVIQLINNIIAIGSLLAVGAIVYAGILYTIAAGDDERIKSAKNALKFGIIGFIVMLLSFPAVNALVNLFYSTAGG